MTVAGQEGRDVQDEPIVATEDDQSVALSTSPEFLRIVQAAREEVERGEVLSLEEMKREVL